MYAHLFSVRFQKQRHGGHICFLTPMVTLFWPIHVSYLLTYLLTYCISKIVQDRGLFTIIHI